MSVCPNNHSLILSTTLSVRCLNYHSVCLPFGLSEPPFCLSTILSVCLNYHSVCLNYHSVCLNYHSVCLPVCLSELPGILYFYHSVFLNYHFMQLSACLPFCLSKLTFGLCTILTVSLQQIRLTKNRPPTRYDDEKE